MYDCRKKKKDKEKKKLSEQQIRTSSNTEEESQKTYVDKRTPAQMAFDKIQEKRVSVSYVNSINLRLSYKDVMTTLSKLFLWKSSN